MGMGLSLRYAGAAAIDVPVLELHGRPGAGPPRASSRRAELMARRDADVLVLGCMSLSFLGVAEHVRQQVGVPVVNPAVVRAQDRRVARGQGLRPSRRRYARPRRNFSPRSRPG